MVSYPAFSFAKAITPSDTVNLDGQTYSAGKYAKPADGIYVGGAGVVVAVFQDGSTVNFTATAGSTLPIRPIRINSTSTTATLLVALYQV